MGNHAIVRPSADDSAAVSTRVDRPPGPVDVTVRVAAAGLCFVEDALLDGRRKRGTYPRVMGHEGAGTVGDAGTEVDDLATGARVLLLPRAGCGRCRACLAQRPILCADPVILGQDRDGCWSDTITLPRTSVLPVPDGVPLPVAAAVGCAGVSAFNAVARAVSEPGGTVLVRGVTTGIGCYAAVLGLAAGCARVYGVTRSERHAAALTGLGIDPVVCADPDPWASFATVRSAVDGGVDALIDVVADWRGQDYSRLVARGGRVVFVGDMTGQPVPLNPSLLIYRNQSVLTADLGGVGDAERLLALLAAGRVRLPVVEHAGGVEALAGLLADPTTRHTGLGRDIVTW